jgi:hypothetical protein
VTDQLETGRVVTLAGGIALAQGQFTKAQAELGEAKAIFMRLGATRDLAQVRRMLKRQTETQVVVA